MKTPKFEVLVRIDGFEQYRARYDTWRASEDDYRDCLEAAAADVIAKREQRPVEVVKLKDGEFAARWSSERYLALMRAIAP
jgi:hypothetical protein